MIRSALMLLLATVFVTPMDAMAATPVGEAVDALSGEGTTPVMRAFLFLSLLTFLPAMLIAVTSFTRNIVVLSLLRHALGLQQTPPNVVLITLAVFLTLFTMGPTLQAVHSDALSPYLAGEASADQALVAAEEPMRSFMVSQTRASDMRLILELADAPAPESAEGVAFMHLVPAFMLSELKTAFQIGFVIFLPFLLIDLVVAAILMSLGMIMVPPIAISLPIKIMLFVLIDGWGLVIRALLTGYG